MSDRAHNDITGPLGEGLGEGRARHRDPRMRPPDPAGTQPKVDPRSLEPAPIPGQLALGAAPIGLPTPVSEGRGDGSLLPVPVDNSSAQLASEALSTHRPRFHFLYGALGATGIAAIALAVAVATRPPTKPGPSWSGWKPTDAGGDPAAQIAEHVQPRYKLPDGKTLVSVSGGPQAVGGQPVVLALRSSGSEPSALPSTGVFYQLCGTGPSCSIPGKASLQRGLLVRREALELALYTFRYIESASQVVVTFPPPPPAKGTHSSSSHTSTESTSTSSSRTSSSSSQSPNRVLLFRPSELSAELSRPLYDSLSSRVPGVRDIDSSPEAALIDRLTINALYDSTLSQQESTLVMLLQSPSLGG